MGSSAQHTVIGTTTDSEGNVHDVLLANFAPTSRSRQYSRWFVCPTCARTYRWNQGITVNNIRYCTVEPCGGEAIQRANRDY